MVREWGINRVRTGEVHRSNMTEAQAREWLDDWIDLVSPTGNPNAFSLVSREDSPWQDED